MKNEKSFVWEVLTKIWSVVSNVYCAIILIGSILILIGVVVAEGLSMDKYAESIIIEGGIFIFVVVMILIIFLIFAFIYILLIFLKEYTVPLVVCTICSITSTIFCVFYSLVFIVFLIVLFVLLILGASVNNCEDSMDDSPCFSYLLIFILYVVFVAPCIVCIGFFVVTVCFLSISNTFLLAGTFRNKPQKHGNFQSRLKELKFW